MRLFPMLLIALLCSAVTSPVATAQTPILLQSPEIRILGRYQALPNHDIRLAYPGTGLLVHFSGPSLSLTLTANSASSALTAVIDHGEPSLILLKKGAQTVPIAEDLASGPHIAEIYKRTETWQGLLDLTSLQVAPGSGLLPATPAPVRKLMFLGDSVTCGTAVDDNPTCKNDPLHPSTDAYHTYAMDLGRRLDAQTDLVCFGGRGLERTYDGKTLKDGILNAPDFLDLAVPTDDPATRAAWDSHSFIPDAIVVSLGTNDFSLEPTQPLDASAWVADYVKLLHRLRAEYPAATILATEGAIVTNPLLRQYIQSAVQQAQDPNVRWARATHYPGSSCNGHPTREQHSHMADDLEPQLRTTLHW
jgi:lysophospholipase L1-like esterase